MDLAYKRVWGPSPRYPLVRAYKPKTNKFIQIAGPCSVESIEQIHFLAKLVASAGATHLRGGVFRCGTYPGANFGYVNMDLIDAYHEAAQVNNLKNIIEVLDYSQPRLDVIAKFADCFQVGCRQMQNYTLLRTLGQYKKPVFLKRNPGATLDEWLGAAEHLLAGGCDEVILIERGSSSHVNHVRWDLSISMIPAVKAISEIQVICDASHGTGRRDLVEPMALAGVAAGAAGILVEVHPEPDKSISDSEQALDPNQFLQLIKKARAVRSALI